MTINKSMENPDLYPATPSEHPDDLGYHPEPPRRGVEVVWWSVLLFTTIHLVFLYSVYMNLFYVKLATTLWAFIYGYGAGACVTIGAHRLFCHRSFKAHPLLRLALVLYYTAAGQFTMYAWIRIHRLHHKYTETDADPHNAQRGLFYSHVGWLMCQRQPERVEKEWKIDMSDIEADPYIMFQKRYYRPLSLLMTVFIPMAVPCYLWGESPFNSFMSAVVFRTVLGWNISFSVNSVAHMFGTRPFTGKFHAVESALVSFIGLGEGWHNYHHTFPWDYRASEFGQKFNLSTTIIDIFHKLGWVWDLKFATPDMVRHRILRHGDGSHPLIISQIPPDSVLMYGGETNCLVTSETL